MTASNTPMARLDRGDVGSTRRPVRASLVSVGGGMVAARSVPGACPTRRCSVQEGVVSRAHSKRIAPGHYEVLVGSESVGFLFTDPETDKRWPWRFSPSRAWEYDVDRFATKHDALIGVPRLRIVGAP